MPDHSRLDVLTVACRVGQASRRGGQRPKREHFSCAFNLTLPTNDRRTVLITLLYIGSSLGLLPAQPVTYTKPGRSTGRAEYEVQERECWEDEIPDLRSSPSEPLTSKHSKSDSCNY